jgi:hypothetical protein
LQVQAQGSYRSIQGLNDRQRLDLNRYFKLVEELRNSRERRSRHKRPVEEIVFLPFDPHLAKLPLLGVHEINAVPNIS